MSDTLTLQQYIERHGISMTAERVDCNPNMDGENMDHWKVVFVRRDGKRIATKLLAVLIGRRAP